MQMYLISYMNKPLKHEMNHIGMPFFRDKQTDYPFAETANVVQNKRLWESLDSQILADDWPWYRVGRMLYAPITIIVLTMKDILSLNFKATEESELWLSFLWSCQSQKRTCLVPWGSTLRKH